MAAGDWRVARRWYERGIVGWRDEIEVQTRVLAPARAWRWATRNRAKAWRDEAVAVNAPKAIEASRQVGPVAPCRHGTAEPGRDRYYVFRLPFLNWFVDIKAT